MNDTQTQPTIPVIPTGLDDDQMDLFTRLAMAMFEIIQEAHTNEPKPIPLPPLSHQPSVN